MNFNSTISFNESVPRSKGTSFRTGTKSMIQRRQQRSDSKLSQQPNGESVFSKIKKVFSSRIPNNSEKTTIRDINVDGLRNKGSAKFDELNDRTHLRAPNQMSFFKDNESLSHTHKSLIESHKDHNVDWQPVFHETCKIKLPLEESVKKIAIPQEAIDEWMQDNSRVTQRNKNSIFAKHKNNVEKDNDMDESNSDKTCGLKNALTKGSCGPNKKEEPYTKFKCYYNYYLVDEYLDSIAELEEQKKNMPKELQEQADLYDTIELSAKPIITTKERLESGIPFDPKGLLAKN